MKRESSPSTPHSEPTEPKDNRPARGLSRRQRWGVVGAFVAGLAGIGAGGVHATSGNTVPGHPVAAAEAAASPANYIRGEKRNDAISDLAGDFAKAILADAQAHPNQVQLSDTDGDGKPDHLTDTRSAGGHFYTFDVNVKPDGENWTVDKFNSGVSAIKSEQPLADGIDREGAEYHKTGAPGDDGEQPWSVSIGGGNGRKGGAHISDLDAAQQSTTPDLQEIEQNTQQRFEEYLAEAGINR